MKKISYWLHEKNKGNYIWFLMIVLLFGGCKKNSDAIDSGVIETKLCSGNSQQWKVPIVLTSPSCVGTATVLLTLKSDHTFTYNGNCSFSGNWTAEYTANRSGQLILLNLEYFNGTFYQTDIFSLKYSFDQDTFYALDPNTLELYPFVKYNLAP